MTAQFKDKIVYYILLLAASMSIVIVFLILLFLFKEAWPLLVAEDSPGFAHLFTTEWVPTSPTVERFGIIPLITGSLLVTIIAVVIAVPLGVITAIYLAEVATVAEREFLKPFLELLAGFPSVVFGFFGLVLLSPLIKDAFKLESGVCALTGAGLLALMALPTIITITEDAIQNVPSSFKHGSLALGATKLQTIFTVTLPAALSGIVAAVMLGIGRVIGETMVVLMVTGNAALITVNPLDPVRTMTGTIAGDMGEIVQGSMHYTVLFWIGLILLALTWGLNELSQIFLRKYRMGN